MWVDANQVDAVLSLLWRASWQAAILTALVLLLQFIFRKQLTARWRYNLWLVVLLRLLLPVLPESRLSIYNLLATHPPAPMAADAITAPAFPGAELGAVGLALPPDVAADPTRDYPANWIDIGTIASASPPPAPAEPFPWRRAFGALWLIGVFFFLARIFIATIKLHRLARRLDVVADPELLGLVDACQSALRVRRHVTVLSSPEIPAPALMGFLKPRLLLPAQLLVDFDRRELWLILMHELAHVRRRDVAVNWLMTLLHALHWFNPVLWLAFSRMRFDRELATDELVLAASQPDDRRLYGRTILKLLQTLSRRSVLPGMVGILEGIHPLRRRITMIAHFNDRRPWSALALLAALALAAVTLTDSVRGQNAADDRREEKGAVSQDQPGGENDRDSLTAPANDPGGDPRAADGRRPQQRLRDRRDRELGRGGYGGGRGFGGDFGDGGGSIGGTADPSARSRSLRGAEANPAMRATLERSLPEVQFDNVAFSEVIDFLRDVTGANIFVNWRSLEAAGIDRNVTVSMRMKNVSFETVLSLLLEGTAPGILRYDIDGGVIIISADSAAAAQAMQNPLGPGMGGMPGGGMPGGQPVTIQSAVTRVYEVRDLLSSISPAIDPDSEARDPQLSELRRRRAELLNQFGPEHREVVTIDSRIRARVSELAHSGQWDHRARMSRLTELVSIIQETIGQEQPLNVRGFNTKLIVRAAPDTQSEVQKLLAMLREGNSEGKAERPGR